MRHSFFKRSRSASLQARRNFLSARFRPRLELLEDRRVLATILVDTFADVVADDGQTSLREAIAEVATLSGGDTIEVPAGTYNLSQLLGQLLVHDLSGSVTIESSGGTAIVSAQQSSRVLEVSGPSVVNLDGIVVTGGSAPSGGGILNSGTLALLDSAVSNSFAGQSGGGIQNFGSLSLVDSAVTDNLVNSGQGGGIANVGGTVSLEGSVVSGNILQFGPGGGIYNSGTLTALDSSVSNNGAFFGDGGGIFNAGPFGTTTIEGSTLSGNVAGLSGGAIGNSGELTVSDSELQGNLGGFTGGGGIFNSGNATIADSTLAANAAGSGGGVSNVGLLSIADTTFSGNNTTFDSGGGLDNLGTATVADSIFANNLALSFGGGIANRGTLTVSDTTLTGNSANGDGGGLANRGSATVSDSTFELNSAGAFGGGIANDGQFGGGPALSLSGSTIASNTASFGGGGVFNNFAAATIENSIVEGNSAGSGGGIYNQAFFGGATVNIDASTIRNNSASFFGGGVLNFGAATMNVSASVIHDNSAGFNGGGAFNQSFSGADASLTVTNSTLSGNTAAGSGGGIHNDGTFGGIATLNVTSATISGNSAAVQGGGINNLGSATVGNTIVAENAAPVAPDVFGAFNSAGYNLIGIGDGSSGFGATGDQVGTAASPIDPLLGPLQDNGGPTWTMALLPGSPAIDAGDPGLAGTTDQRGVLRPQGTGVDIGAFEVVFHTVDVAAKSPINLSSNGTTKFVLTGSDDFDVSQVDLSDLALILLGDPALAGKVSPLEAKLKDVDGDGRLDLELKFSTAELVDSGALNAASTAILLTGWTVGGEGFLGTAPVQIVND